MPTAKKLSTRRMVMTRSPRETQAFASKFAKELVPGDVVRLDGDLGSGKTVFVKGLARGLGLADANAVKSPTFVLMHIYKARVPLYHFDLYRLEGAAEIESIGLEEFTHDSSAVICVEWAERGAAFFPKSSYRVRLAITGETTRQITIQGGRARKKGIS